MSKPRRITLSLDLQTLPFQGAVWTARTLAPHAMQLEEGRFTLIFDSNDLQDDARRDSTIVLIATIPGAADRLADQLEAEGRRLSDGLEVELTIAKNPEAAPVAPNHEGGTQRLSRLQ